MSIEDASAFETPFEYVRTKVKPERDKVRNKLEKELWWIHGRPGPDLRKSLQKINRYIATSRVSKHRTFVFIDAKTLPDNAVVIIARDDHYIFGVVQSRPHLVWALEIGTSLEDRPRYSQTLTFETFPFPWVPGSEPVDDPRVQAIGAAAKELVEMRERWLNPTPSQPPPNPKNGDLGEGPRRTLTNLYNARPTWLDLAHKRLDAAVFAAYGWPVDLSDDEILERLLRLNLERAGK